MTRRHDDWPTRLAAALEAARGRPFRWGAHDCCLFACDMVAAMTGCDPARNWRGIYATALEARYLLARYHGGGLNCAVPALAEACGFAEIAPRRAGRGDLVLLPLKGHGFGHALTIRLGAGVLALTEAEGLTALSLAADSRAWKV